MRGRAGRDMQDAGAKGNQSVRAKSSEEQNPGRTSTQSEEPHRKDRRHNLIDTRDIYQRQQHDQHTSNQLVGCPKPRGSYQYGEAADCQVSDVTGWDAKIDAYMLSFHGRLLLEGAEIALNYGQRHGLLRENGSGKSTFLQSIAESDIAIPDHIDIYLMKGEAEPLRLNARLLMHHYNSTAFVRLWHADNMGDASDIPANYSSCRIPVTRRTTPVTTQTTPAAWRLTWGHAYSRSDPRTCFIDNTRQRPYVFLPYTSIPGHSR